jgi:hypothetical protein
MPAITTRSNFFARSGSTVRANAAPTFQAASIWSGNASTRPSMSVAS